ncbi:hypothetical protein [Wenling thamnaconus septentrionalis filovirus]|uniref:Uncharacterized protein n=1 Tax=Wenling thamnaconus septentrionalis filovirus TaxID=2116488 RepID=A0A2P1GMP6_9MONO|nr:hypothetical protein KM520_gp3 [Wenling thamnaconus septentrionalis filovirus]AVM87244.1 hypothetical protein [Wenling thamnaconus septentrionalis filovirus]
MSTSEKEMANRIMKDSDLQVIGLLLDGLDDQGLDVRALPDPTGNRDYTDVSTFKDLFPMMSTSELIGSLSASGYSDQLEKSIESTGRKLADLARSAPADDNAVQFMKSYLLMCEKTGQEHSVSLPKEERKGEKKTGEHMKPEQSQGPQPTDKNKTAAKAGPSETGKANEEEVTNKTPAPRRNTPKALSGAETNDSPLSTQLTQTPEEAGDMFSGKAEGIVSGELRTGKKLPTIVEGCDASGRGDVTHLYRSHELVERIQKGEKTMGIACLKALVMGEDNFSGVPFDDILDCFGETCDDPDTPGLRGLMEGSNGPASGLPCTDDYCGPSTVLFDRWAKAGSLGCVNYMIRRCMGDLYDGLRAAACDTPAYYHEMAQQQKDCTDQVVKVVSGMEEMGEAMQELRRENTEMKRRIADMAAAMEHLSGVVSSLSSKLETAVVVSSGYPSSKETAAGIKGSTYNEDQQTWKTGVSSWQKRETSIWTNPSERSPQELNTHGGIGEDDSEAFLKQLEEQWAAESSDPLSFGTSGRGINDQDFVRETLTGTPYEGDYNASRESKKGPRF